MIKSRRGEVEHELEDVRGQIESVSGICKRLPPDSDACGQPEDILLEFCKLTDYLAEERMLLVSSFGVPEVFRNRATISWSTPEKN